MMERKKDWYLKVGERRGRTVKTEKLAYSLSYAPFEERTREPKRRGYF